jgi:hypothetical protein
MMTGNGVMHNGTTVIDEYGQNLDRLQVSIIVRGSNFPLKCLRLYEEYVRTHVWWLKIISGLFVWLILECMLEQCC